MRPNRILDAAAQCQATAFANSLRFNFAKSNEWRRLCGLRLLFLAEELGIDYDKVRAIVASGYSEDPIMAHHREAGFRAALPKPFKLRDLARMIEDVMAS